MKIDLDQVQTIGAGIVRPEGVMALDDGTILTADGRGRCARISPEGETSFYGELEGLPNGICVDAQGNCIIANIGNGQVQSLAPDGTHEVLLTEADGKNVTSPNFPFIDSKDRLWVSNSTARTDVQSALSEPGPDGAVVLVENGIGRIVADGLSFANGLTLDQDEEYLYVAETMERLITRFKVAGDGSLSNRETYGPKPLGDLGFPDGIAFDEAGNLWLTFPSWNAVGYITPNEDLEMVLEDPDRKILNSPTNICFGWQERKTAFIGSLNGTTIPYFQVPHPGLKLIHQKYRQRL